MNAQSITSGLGEKSDDRRRGVVRFLVLEIDAADDRFLVHAVELNRHTRREDYRDWLRWVRSNFRRPRYEIVVDQPDRQPRRATTPRQLAIANARMMLSEEARLRDAAAEARQTFREILADYKAEELY